MVNPLSNPFYLLTPLIGAVISFALALLVLRKDSRSLANRLFFLVLLSLSSWAVFSFLMRASPDVEHALYWDRLVFPAAFAMFIFYYHFTCAYTRTDPKKSLWVAYSFLVAACILSPTGFLISHMTLGAYGYAPHFLPPLYVLSVAGFLFLLMGLINLVRAFRVPIRYEERTRIGYMIVAIVILFSFAIIDFFPNHPPMGTIGNVLFATVTAVAILKYHLLDIRVAVRRGVAYLLMSALVAIPYLLILYIFNRVLNQALRIEILVALLVLLALGFNPLWQRVQRIVDGWFYRERYNFLRELEHFSQEAHDISDIRQLGASLTGLLGKALHASDIHLLLLSQSQDFVPVASTSERSHQFNLKRNHPLIRWLRHSGRSLYCRELDITPELQSMSVDERHTLEMLGAEIFIPLETKKRELVGLLVLGRKLSGQLYSHEDEQLVLTVAGRIAVEVENARLYEEARQSQEALRESERLFKTIVEAAPSFLMITEADGNTLYVSPNCRQLTGYTQEELRHGVAPWVHDDDRTRLEHTLRRVFSEGLEVRNFEYKALRKDGQPWYASSSWQPLRDETGNIRAAVIQTIDITEQRQAEEAKRELAEKAQLASRLASVGEMASGVAHEINNPLTGVIGYSGLLMKQELPDDIKKKLRVIHDSAKQVADIISRLLTFARQHKPAHTYVDINEIVKTTIALRTYAMKTSNIKVTAQFAPDLLQTMADASQLQQVFLNIIINAETEMKLAHGKGTLWVTTECDDNTIRISFRDDGPGIADENLGRIFDPFFTTRDVGQGTGLGLSICHGIIAEHSGRIYAKSKLGKGATFIVELPVVAAEKQAESGETGEEHERNGRQKILVVDDEPVVLEFIRDALVGEGYVVETMNSAKLALAMIRKKEYSLILLDIKLPGMSGIEVYKYIQQESPSLVEKIVFITGDIMGPDTKEFLSRTKAHCIAKPFNHKQLTKEIARILSRTI